MEEFLRMLLDAGVLWATIPLAALSIPIVAIINANISARQKLRISSLEKAESRKLYERIAMEKLDIIKTAISMGYKTEELAELDRRLEMLVGADKMSELLDDSGKARSKDSGKSEKPVKVKVNMTTVSDRPAQMRVPSPAQSGHDTTEELLLSSDDLMDKAMLEALSKELEQRRHSKA